MVFLGRGKTAECGAYWTAITPGGKLLFSRGDGHQLNVVVADDVWLSLRSCPANANLENLAGRWRFCYVNPARCTIGNDLDRKTCRRAGRFIPNQVFVISAIHQRRTICRAWAIYLGRTVGMILSYLSGRDDDQAVTRVLMPACTPSGQPRIALHVQV